MYSNHIFHFALVHQEFSRTGDLTLGLLPLFSPLLAGKEGTQFSSKTFCNEVEQNYGINMHPYVAEDIAAKLCSKGFLTESLKSKPNEKIYIINKINDISDENLNNQIENFYAKFEQFSRKVLNNSSEKADSIDFHYEFSKRLARYDSSKESIDTTHAKSQILDWCFVRFVKFIEERGGESLQALQNAYSGAILSEVVLSLKEPSIEAKSINGKKFYIDAPILINIIGFSDEYSVKCSRDLISQINKYGGIVTTTDYYIKEASVSIGASLENHRQLGTRHSQLDQFIFKNPEKILDLRTAQFQIDKILREEYNFSLDDQLAKIDQKIISRRAVELKEKITQSLMWYQKDLARENDAKSITFVVADHSYNSIKNISESKSFLVSNNISMIQAANETLYRMSSFNKPEMTPLLSEKKLAVLLWVITGGKGTDISQLSLLSSCNRAIEMHADLFANIKDFLKKLKPEDAAHYEHIMTNDRLMYCLIDEIGLNSNKINENNINEYITRAENSLENEIDDIKRSLNDEVNKLRTALSRERSQREKALIALQSKIKEAEEAKENLNSLNNSIQINKQNETIPTNHTEQKTTEPEIIPQTKIEENIRSIVSGTIKFTILIAGALIIYNLNGITSIKISDTEIGENSVKSIAALVSACFTWFLPEKIFNKPAEIISDKIISALSR